MKHPTTSQPPSAFDFSRLKARWAREREARRSESDRLRGEVIRIVTPILRAHRVTRAYLFGSLVEHRAGKRSDVDLLVLGVDAETFWNLRHELESALDRPLDLFTQDDDPSFVAKIETRGERIYG